MKRTLFFIFSALLCAESLSAQKVWTLQECIEYALKHNITIKQQHNQVKQVEIERQELKNSYLPDLNLGGSQKLDFGRSLTRDNTYEDSNSQSSSFSLTSEMPLFSGFRTSNSIARNKYDLQATKEGLEVIKNNLSLNITSCYFQILLQKEIYQIALEQIELTKEQESRTQLLVESGKVPQSQIYEMRAQIADDELTATEAKNSLRLSFLELIQLLEWEEDQPVDIATLTDTVVNHAKINSPKEIFQISLQVMPQIKESQYSLQSAQKNIKVMQAGYYPTLSLGAGISSGYYHVNGVENTAFNEQFKNNMQKTVYLSLNIPLFNRFSTRSKVRTAKVEANNASLSLENEKKKLYKEIEKAYTDAMAAKEKYSSTSKSVQANEEAHRYIHERYASGKATVYEYNESKLKLANAQSQQAQAKYMYLLKMKVLDFYTGIPLN